jgi:methylenetetrahydrofolate/methylenetetrahydromethanopterin dehydrogenase (NADP+)
VPVESGAGVPRGSPLGVAVAGADVIVSAGAAGAVLLDAAGRSLAGRARVLIDLNAVPPAGIDGIEASDKARRVEAAVVYGALGVGGTKMKIHRAAIGRIFAATDACLDAEELLAIGESL